jgi:hypothetical protein
VAPVGPPALLETNVSTGNVPLSAEKELPTAEDGAFRFLLTPIIAATVEPPVLLDKAV